MILMDEIAIPAGGSLDFVILAKKGNHSFKIFGMQNLVKRHLLFLRSNRLFSFYRIRTRPVFIQLHGIN
jgi:hypothetical protein